MAYAKPNPKKVKFDEERPKREFKEARNKALSEERQRRIKIEQIRACYRPGKSILSDGSEAEGYSPPHIANAGVMMAGERFQAAVHGNEIAYQRIGRSGRGNLYLCRAVSNA